MIIVISANNIDTLSCGCFAAFSVTPDCPFSFFVASATGIEVKRLIRIRLLMVVRDLRVALRAFIYSGKL
jgi:hypothetical protein